MDLVVYAFTDLGMKVAINNRYTGMVYKNQIYDSYKEGQKIKGYITGIR